MKGLTRCFSGYDYLQCRHKDLSSNPQEPCKKPGIPQNVPESRALGGVRVWGAETDGHQPNSKFNKRTCLWGIRGGIQHDS